MPRSAPQPFCCTSTSSTLCQRRYASVAFAPCEMSESILIHSTDAHGCGPTLTAPSNHDGEGGRKIAKMWRAVLVELQAWRRVCLTVACTRRSYPRSSVQAKAASAVSVVIFKSFTSPVHYARCAASIIWGAQLHSLAHDLHCPQRCQTPCIGSALREFNIRLMNVARGDAGACRGDAGALEHAESNDGLSLMACPGFILVSRKSTSVPSLQA